MKLTSYHPFKSSKHKEEYLTFYDNLEKKRWTVASESRTVETSYGQKFLRVSGPTDGKPLVLLPGGGCSSLCWYSNIKDLSSKFRTFAIDSINDFGRSINCRPLTRPEDYKGWLDELLTALNLHTNISLMGISYGGWVASQYALYSQDRLDKVILIAPAATILPLSMDYFIHSLPCPIHPYFIRIMMLWVFKEFMKKNESDWTTVDDLIVEMQMNFRCFKLRMPAFPTILTKKQWQSIKVPTLFLVGEHEKIYSAKKAIAKFVKESPHIKAEVLPDAGHDLTFSQAELFNRKVIEFLDPV